MKRATSVVVYADQLGNIGVGGGGESISHQREGSSGADTVIIIVIHSFRLLPVSRNFFLWGTWVGERESSRLIGRRRRRLFGEKFVWAKRFQRTRGPTPPSSPPSRRLLSISARCFSPFKCFWLTFLSRKKKIKSRCLVRSLFAEQVWITNVFFFLFRHLTRGTATKTDLKEPGRRWRGRKTTNVLYWGKIITRRDKKTFTSVVVVSIDQQLLAFDFH